MDKEIVWTDIAKNDLKNIFSYLQINWPPEVLDSIKKDHIVILRIKHTAMK
jgi:plasmid stabilization system protein ParE